ncbi:MAG: exopolysaccharide biosynthesis polyprenyl glycosylphosphotransferase [Bryobacterales bacterium]|nr:exopolysaccharide biosynthesis polyprenyl glycosylphosphotransferase [Bryobacterales bacterium]
MTVLALSRITRISFRARSWAPWAFVLSDVLSLELALILGCLLRLAMSVWFPFELGPELYRGLAIGILIIPLVFGLTGLYPGYGLGALERFRGRIYATFLVFAVLIGWDYLILARQWSRGILLGTLLFALLIPPVVEAWVREALSLRGWWGIPVAILGAGRTGQTVARCLNRDRSLGMVPVVVLDDDRAKWNQVLEGVPVLGPLDRVGELGEDVKGIILAMPGLDRPRLMGLLNDLSFPHIILIPNLFGVQSLWVSARDFGGVLGLEIKKNLLVPSNRVLKRALDLAFGVPLLILCAPLLGLLALWIKLVDRGPAFYGQWREGADGTPIRVWKLRTMCQNTEPMLELYLAKYPDEREHWQQHFKLRKDPRVLPCVGAFLRRSSLDELPQLWNVVRGEMSLVGPRPFPDYHLQSFPAEFRGLRRSVLPGITGLWQVSARSDGDLQIQQSQDTYYIRNWSLWLDLHILVRTVGAVLARQGAY